MDDGRSERHLRRDPDRAFSLMSVLTEIGRLSTKNYTVPAAPVSPSHIVSGSRGRLIARWREWEIGRFLLAALVLFTLLCADPERVADSSDGGAGPVSGEHANGRYPSGPDGVMLAPASEGASEFSAVATCDGFEGVANGQCHDRQRDERD